MNGIFGTAFVRESGPGITEIASQASNIFGREPHIVSLPENMSIGCVSDGGSVAGIAEKNGISIALLAAFQKPFPEWGDGSPLDNPNKTAEHLISLYEKHGERFLDYVYGQFAVAVFDSNKKRVFLAADRDEMRTLYYVVIDGALYFSSNQYILARSLRTRISYDRSYEDFFLVYGILPPQRTFFEGMRSVKPASIIEWTGGVNTTIHPIADTDPWEDSFAKTDWESLDEEQGIDVVYQAFMTALEEQTASTKRAAVLLGGFDSSLVAAGLVHLGKEVETFTYQYADESYNQPHIDTLQKFLGHKHHWIRVTEEDIRQGLIDYSYRYNKATNWPNYVIQTHKLATAIRKEGFVHCYSGDGCDDVFLGYPIVHLRARMFSAPLRIPQPLLKTIIAIARPGLWENYLGHVFTVGLNVIRSLARSWPERGYLTFRVFDELCLEKLRTNGRPEGSVEIEKVLTELTQGLENLSPARLAYLGKFAINPNWVKMIGSSDCEGITIHAPYIHAGMAKFARNIPDDLCRPKEKTEAKITGKYILMKMAEKKKLLSYDSIYQRKFPAVDAPIDDWYAGPLRNTVSDLVKNLPFEFDSKYVESLIEPKKIESLYKSVVSLDRLCSSHTMSLLCTYASYTKALKD